MIGHCRLRNAVRVFRVDRIQELSVGRETYRMPDDFDVHRYLAQESWFPPQFQVRMWLSPQAAPEARDEDRTWDTMEEEPDGSLVVTFGATDLGWAARVVLWYGPGVEVLEPEDLRRRMSEHARTVAAKYSSSE